MEMTAKKRIETLGDYRNVASLLKAAIESNDVEAIENLSACAEEMYDSLRYQAPWITKRTDEQLGMQEVFKAARVIYCEVRDYWIKTQNEDLVPYEG